MRASVAPALLTRILFYLLEGKVDRYPLQIGKIERHTRRLTPWIKRTWRPGAYLPDVQVDILPSSGCTQIPHPRGHVLVAAQIANSDLAKNRNEDFDHRFPRLEL